MSRLSSFAAGILGAATIAGLLLIGTGAAVSAASSFSATTLYNVCTLHGGHNGYGHMNLNVRGTEYGYSGTDCIRQVGYIQVWTGSRWRSGPASVSKSPQLTPASSTNSWTVHWNHSFTSGDLASYHRVLVRVQFWDRRSGADKLLKQISRYSEFC